MHELLLGLFLCLLSPVDFDVLSALYLFVHYTSLSLLEEPSFPALVYGYVVLFGFFLS